MADPNLPKCSKCKSNDSVFEDGDRYFWCASCHQLFDAAPDEGGTHSNNPVRSAERNEQHESRQAVRQRRQRGEFRIHRGRHRRKER
jgi:hypothetical protein